MSSKKWQSVRENIRFLVPLVLFFLQYHLHLLLVEASTTNIHIVYLGEKKHDDPAVTKKSHYKLLSDFLGSTEAAKKSIIYSYKHGFSGFAAKLTDTEAKAIAKHPEVVKVVKDHTVKPHTTRSWDFLGINHVNPQNLLTKNLGRGTIIGVIDTGVWPESESFKDDGMPEIPTHWKGVCQSGQEFNRSNCNKKIIGARWFIKGYKEMYNINTSNFDEYLSPRDFNHHGSHTASTAGGNFVDKANVDGLATGIARGGAPRAHLAIYKTMWGAGSGTGSDCLKAFDQAIHDGVDIMSASLGGKVPFSDYNEMDDLVSIGSFHATAKGVTVVASAGNDGPGSQTIGNTAPWIISVAATTVDRAFPTAIALGNNSTIWGQSITFGKTSHVSGALTYSVLVLSENATSLSCAQGNLDRKLTKGKIVVCYAGIIPDASSAADAVMEAGGVGIIFAQQHTDLFYPCSIPCAIVDYTTASQILSYIADAESPTVKLSYPRTSIGKVTSPRVATFSSRGPSSLTPEVLKPDVAAPGVDILAAVPKGVYEFMSGTSMACPHVSGIVALIKSIHKDWTPSDIRSALVTTATQVGTDGSDIYAEGPNRKPADPFDIGGGLVNPMEVSDPGLIYNVTTQDYIDYLCATGYESSSLTVLTNKRKNCNSRKDYSPLDLNLPSISVINLKKGIEVTVTRTVTNVGDVNSMYKAVIESPPGISISVEPQTLKFDSVTKILSFKVSFLSKKNIQGHYRFGSLTWNDGKHRVRSPIVVRMIVFESYSDA